MMSGTSTGSILATSLAIPKTVGSNEPKFWASDAVKIYADGGPDIFQKSSISVVQTYFCYASFILTFTCLFLYLGNKRYNNQKKYNELIEMELFLDEQLAIIEARKQKK